MLYLLLVNKRFLRPNICSIHSEQHFIKWLNDANNKVRKCPNKKWQVKRKLLINIDYCFNNVITFYSRTVPRNDTIKKVKINQMFKANPFNCMHIFPILKHL